MVRKQGFCHGCGQLHDYDVMGGSTPLGLVIGLAAAVRFRNPWPAVAMLVVGVVLDVVEERLAAKCPTCAVALDLVRVVARA